MIGTNEIFHDAELVQSILQLMESGHDAREVLTKLSTIVESGIDIDAIIDAELQKCGAGRLDIKRRRSMTDKAKICKGDICLFCNSKCPSCGSTNINVRYAPVYKFENDIENHIRVSCVDSGLELTCNDCDESFGDVPFMDGVDDELAPLASAIDRLLELPIDGHLESMALPDGSHEEKRSLVYPVSD